MNSAVRGSIIGLACADALGAPYEWIKTPEIDTLNYTCGGLHNLPAGETTDDAALACALAESLAECGGFSPDDAMERMAAEYLKHPELYGPTSSGVFTDYLQGGRANKKARLAASSKYYLDGIKSGTVRGRSNGSVMRAAPEGLFYAPDRAYEYGFKSSMLTHFNPDACICAGFISLFVSCLSRGYEKGDALDAALSQIPERCDLRSALADKKRIMMPDMDCVNTVHCAVSVFMNSSSFEETVTSAVRLGLDTDTTGAVAGAAAGAYYGYEAIPKRWTDGLRDFERYLNIADRLAAAIEKNLHEISSRPVL